MHIYDFDIAITHDGQVLHGPKASLVIFHEPWRLKKRRKGYVTIGGVKSLDQQVNEIIASL